jgi:hypothetical protein
MNKPLLPHQLRPDASLPQHLVSAHASPQDQLPLATEGIQRWVWQGRYGDMLIEVEGEAVRVNGQPVIRLAP